MYDWAQPGIKQAALSPMMKFVGQSVRNLNTPFNRHIGRLVQRQTQLKHCHPSISHKTLVVIILYLLSLLQCNAERYWFLLNLFEMRRSPFLQSKYICSKCRKWSKYQHELMPMMQCEGRQIESESGGIQSWNRCLGSSSQLPRSLPTRRQRSYQLYIEVSALSAIDLRRCIIIECRRCGLLRSMMPGCQFVCYATSLCKHCSTDRDPAWVGYF